MTHQGFCIFSLSLSLSLSLLLILKYLEILGECVFNKGFLGFGSSCKLVCVWRVLGNGFFFTCKNDGGKRWGASL